MNKEQKQFKKVVKSREKRVARIKREKEAKAFFKNKSEFKWVEKK